MFKCKDCNKEFNNYTTLRKHRGRVHKIHSSQTYIDYFLNGIHPTCICGCGGFTKWHKKNKGDNKFNPYINGHNNRVVNNWGHNPKAIENSAKTRRKQFAAGERKTWCDGLTKETDDRLKKLGKSVSKSYDEKRKEKYSSQMRELRLSGIVPTRYADESPNWKGGISSVQQFARTDSRMYKQWKYPILVRDNFRCTRCNNTKSLEVHHDKETFGEIVKKVMTIEDYEKINEYEVKKSVTDKVLKYHIDNNVSGVVLCRKCHGKIHPSLNFK